ncbi:gelsolin [Elysia marginata]|uniref:Actin-modulator n=1 Tax=Elysia marginata TaxID=1093978 RepID=A0AAV4GN06_9GAST|nr:gelsolin [Elysia marginata]
MAGLIKAKKYNWKDSNLALFGSDLERKVKKASAATEPAWDGAGKDVGIQIWRIEQFKVCHWPKEDYGKFYSGDSYIILKTYKEGTSEELKYDLHFWIGKESTQDEYGTAAYKTVELDTLLDDLPVQHREVEGHESERFLSYFKSITTMKGGAKTGFRHVEPEKYKPRLLHFCGQRRHVDVKEVPLCKSRINSGDVFILDLGRKIYQWNGSGSNKDERFKAAGYCQELESERCGRAETEVLEESRVDQQHAFFKALVDDDEDDDASEFTAKDTTTETYRLSDASGKMNFKLESKGSISQSQLDSKLKIDFSLEKDDKRTVSSSSSGSSSSSSSSSIIVVVVVVVVVVVIVVVVIVVVLVVVVVII